MEAQVYIGGADPEQDRAFAEINAGVCEADTWKAAHRWIVGTDIILCQNIAALEAQNQVAVEALRLVDIAKTVYEARTLARQALTQIDQQKEVGDE